MVFNKEEASHLKKVDQDDVDEFQIQSIQEIEMRCKDANRVYYNPSSLSPPLLTPFFSPPGFLPLFLLLPNSYHFSGMLSVKVS